MNRMILNIAAIFSFIAAAHASDFTGASKFPVTPMNSAGPQTEPQGKYQEQVFNVPVNGQLIKTLVYKPMKPGPWHIVVMMHGSPGPTGNQLSTFPGPSKWFLDRNYMVVIPTRRGYGASGGSHGDNYGNCKVPNYERGGLNIAKDMEDTLSYFQNQPYALKDGALLIGQSTGGFGSIAASSQNPAGVTAIIDFAGGIGTPGNLCSAPMLYDAAKNYGKTAKVPMLWIYAENDQHFPPFFSNQLYSSYMAGGGNAKYVLLPPFGTGDGHEMFHKVEGVEHWQSTVEEFLIQQHMLASAVLSDNQNNTINIDFSSVPSKCTEQIKAHLSGIKPDGGAYGDNSVLALSISGGQCIWSSTSGRKTLEEGEKAALQICEKQRKEFFPSCFIAMVDDKLSPQFLDSLKPVSGAENN